MLAPAVSVVGPPRYQATKQYERVRRRAWWRKLKSVFGQRTNELLCLTPATVANALKDGAAHAKLEEVPIALIRGSEGRCRDFDGDFQPLQEHTAERWIRVATAEAMGEPLPPVDLVQVGDVYFVRDGHHRVSVAKARGQRYIAAQVVRFRTAAPEMSFS